MNVEKLIRFGFASPRRRLMTICLAGTAAIGSLFGMSGSDEPVRAQPAAPAAQVAEVDYANCDAVRAAGKAPLRRGDPGYSAKLDRDGDGVACS